MMIAEFGHYALVLALALALVQASVPMIGARKDDPVLMAVAGPTAVGQFCFVAMAFAALMTCYVRSDFSVVNVFENSHSAKPFVYKLSGLWGNHEGSMLLWVLILSVFGVLVALFGSNLPARLKANALAVQSLIAVAFILFILITSNPFLRIANAPLEGRDLNPILQDPGLAIHPPLLYLGYVGLSISFSFAIAALIDGRIDAAWARWVRPWTLLAWMFLTLGIAMGSYWAYYTLGWGGWWFWDPVENASFMPWLATTALLHSALVMEKRDALKVWTILLAILAFSLSLIGTFLVRSGVLTSVHAFATDPTRGVFILAILVLFIGGSLTLFALRAPLLKQGGLFAPISREGALVLNNLFLVSACATVFIGTLYPLALEALTGEKISVGAPFFNATFAPLFVPLLIAVPFGPLLAWKRGDLLGAAQRLVGAAGIAVITVAVVFAMEGGGPILVPFAIGLAFYVMAGALTDIVERTGLLKVPLATAFARASGLPRSAWGAAFAHFGLGITLLGVIGETQLPRPRRPFYRAAPRRSHRGDGAVQAQLSFARHRHKPNRAHDARRFSALPVARRPNRGRFAGGAALLQALGAAHLARRGGDGGRRCAVAFGPATAGGRAEGGARQGRTVAGGVDADEVALSCHDAAHVRGCAVRDCGRAERSAF
jgi:cytochrome c-type biogenesis protein CcmF